MSTATTAIIDMETIQEVTRLIVARFHPQKVVLFGSWKHARKMEQEISLTFGETGTSYSFLAYKSRMHGSPEYDQKPQACIFGSANLHLVDIQPCT